MRWAAIVSPLRLPLSMLGVALLVLLLLPPAFRSSNAQDAPATADPGFAARIRIEIESDRQLLRGKPGDLRIVLRDDRALPIPAQSALLRPRSTWTISQGDSNITLRAGAARRVAIDAQGSIRLEGIVVPDDGHFTLELGRGRKIEHRLRTVRPIWALIPPLLSIVLALWLRQVILALAAGIYGGAWILVGDPIQAYQVALLEGIVSSLTDPFQAAILIFTASLGGVVGIMSRAGGTQGLVDGVRRFITGARSSQLATGILGLIIFFDDYANTLLVGNTMRPVTDRMRVSREKLSYLVDSTAAPIATVAVLSTWVGYQVGLIGDGLQTIGRSSTEAYTTFVATIPYASYSWLAMALLFSLVLMRRDFGPMLGAERRARGSGQVLRDGARPLVDDIGADLAPPEGKPRRAHLALLPIAVILLSTVIGLYLNGRQALLQSSGSVGLTESTLRDVFAAADPAGSLLWAVMLGAITAKDLSVGERMLDLQSCLDAWISGAKAMLPALVILVLAWAIGDTCERLGTANVVVDWATGSIAAHWVPTVVFLVAAFLGFSTGTSWGTMAILMPIAIPLAFELPASEGIEGVQARTIFLASVASVLSGSVLGDHCSPISDTTIMSSMASGADHVDHVRTQLPYALSAGAIAIGAGTLPAGFGIVAWWSLPVGLLLCAATARWIGRPTDSN